MKKENKSEKNNGKLDQLVSKLSNDAILSLHAMGCVRGGSGEGGDDNPSIPSPPPT